MGFSDLQYGWHQKQFELAEVHIRSSVELQQRDQKGGWVARTPDVFAETEAAQRESADKFEKIEKRFIKRRSLHAKVRNVGFDHLVFLGIPPDRQSVAEKTAFRVKQLDLMIREVDDEHAARLLGRIGTVCYYEPREEREGTLYAELYVTDDVFDSIERIAIQPNLAVEVSLNVRGWFWLDPIDNSDSELYIDTDERQRAELADFTARRAIPNVRPVVEDDNVRPVVAADDTDRAADPLEDLRRTVTQLRSRVESVQYAVWATAIAAVIIAIRLVG